MLQNNGLYEIGMEELTEITGGGWLSVAGGALIAAGAIVSGGGALVVGVGIAGGVMTAVAGW